MGQHYGGPSMDRTSKFAGDLATGRMIDRE